MTPNDQKIAEAMRKNPQQGFKLLMAAYMQPMYWPHAAWWAVTTMPKTPPRRPW